MASAAAAPYSLPHLTTGEDRLRQNGFEQRHQHLREKKRKNARRERVAVGMRVRIDTYAILL